MLYRILIKNNLLFYLLLFLSVFLIYFHNVSYGVFGGDVGEFLTIPATNGIAHPSGYPLLSILTHIFYHLPFSFTPAIKVNLISVVFSSINACLLFALIYKLQKNRLIALLTSLIFSFSYIVWLYAEVVEVMSLNIFFTLLILYTSLLLYENRKTTTFYFLAFLLGASFAHHQMLILLYPVVLVFNGSYFLKLLKTNKKKILLALLFFLSGFIPYIYLYWAWHNNPKIYSLPLNTWHDYIKMITREDYGYTPNKGTAWELRYLVIKNYVLSIINNVTLPAVFFACIGVFAAIKKNRLLGLTWLSGFIITGPFAILYVSHQLSSEFAIAIIERFYTVSFIFICIFFSFGISYICEIFSHLLKKHFGKNSRNQVYIMVFLFILFFIPYILLIHNFPKTDLSNVTIGNDLGYDLLAPLEKNAVLFVLGDNPVCNIYYVHYVLRFRPDVRVINIGGLGRDSYYNSFKKKVPLNKKDPTEQIAKTITLIAQKRPVYSMFLFEKEKIDSQWIPYGIVYKYEPQKKEKISKEEFIVFNNKAWKMYRYPYKNYPNKPVYGNLFLSDIRSSYAIGLNRYAGYLLLHYKDIKKAQLIYKESLKLYDLNPDTYTGLGNTYILQKRCSDAEKSLLGALTIDPWGKNTYMYLYINAFYCFQKNDKAKEIKKSYNQLFSTSLDKDIEKLMNHKK